MLRTITTTLLLTVVTTATPASAQLLRDGRLYCGAQSYDFDQVMPATESVFDLRRRDLGVLQQAVARAQTACPTSEASEPWCRGFQTASRNYNDLQQEERTACPDATAQGVHALDAQRRCVEFHRQRAASEATLLLAARRAMAHQHCRGTADLRAGACDALIAAETAATPEIAAEIGRRVAGLSQRLVTRTQQPLPMEGLTQQQIVDLRARQRQVLLSLEAYVQRQVGGGAAGARLDDLSESEVDALVASVGDQALRRRLFYLAQGAVPTRASAATETAVLDVLRRLPPPNDSEADTSNIAEQINALAQEQRRCEDADIYVLPSGDVRVNPVAAGTTQRTLCIDVSEFQYQEALAVEFSVSSDEVHNGVRTVQATAWPGVAFPVTIPSSREHVFRMTVRGLPRGRSLRVLANRGVDAQLGPNVRDIDALLQLQREVDAEAGTLRAARDTRRVIALVASLAVHLNSPQVTAALTAMRTAAANIPAQATPDQLVLAKRAVADAVETIRREVDRWQMNDHNPAANLAVANLDTRLQDALRATTRQEMSTAVAALESWRVSPPTVTVPSTLAAMEGNERTLQRALAWVCRVAQTPHRAVVHDLLLPLGDDAFDVVDYDSERGYLGTHRHGPNPRRFGSAARPFLHEVPIYARVSRVASNHNVFILVNGRPIVTSSAQVIGAGSTDASRSTSASANAGAVDDAIPASLSDLSYQLPGTRIVRVGRLEGGMRHNMTVCLGSAATLGAAPAPSGGSTNNLPCSQGQAVANNEVEVHDGYRFGLVAGLGLSVDITDNRPYLARNTPDGNTWTVATNPRALALSAPLLLTWYPLMRDPLSNRFALGLGAGVDLSDPLRRYLLGVTGSFGSFGITVGAMARVPEDASASARAPEGAVVTHMATDGSTPDLARLYGRDTSVQFSLFAAATFDFDLFRRAFETVFKQRLPGIQ